ncbi:MAG: acyl carrier protein [Deltaproteobacteria bacterium]|nr:acyl carrier protein [Deltaproteobacteria bacterium]
MSLKDELKTLVIDALNLDELTVDGIADDAPLLSEELGIDSVDVLELAVAIERRYGIQIGDEQLGREAFASISALARFVERQRALANN